MDAGNRRNLLFAGVGTFVLGAGAYFVFFGSGATTPQPTDPPVVIRNPIPTVEPQRPKIKRPVKKPAAFRDDTRRTRPTSYTSGGERKTRRPGRGGKVEKEEVRPAC